MPELRTTRIRTLANADPEFRIQARFWDTTIRFAVDDTSYAAAIQDGAIASFEAAKAASADAGPPCAIVIAASASDWDELLAPVPRAFWHDLMAAAARQGFTIAGEDLDRDFRPYYPAMRRLIEIMRVAEAS